MSDVGWNRECVERVERAEREKSWLKPSTLKRKRKSMIARMVGFLLGRKF